MEKTLWFPWFILTIFSALRVNTHELTFNPLSPRDAIKHRFISLKFDLIFLQLGVSG